MQTRLSPWSVATVLHAFLSYRGFGKSAGTVLGDGCGG
jgi:hypothetical protein